ncbi:MAG: T9SS type A sorting domain-containing protein [Kosmotogaceae bacterium]
MTYTLTRSGCPTFHTSKTIQVNGPDPSYVDLDVYYSDGTHAPRAGVTWLLCPYTTYHIYLDNNSSCQTSNYSWTIPSGWTKYYQYQNMISINTNSSPGGNVIVNGQTCCTGCGSNVNILSDYLGTYYNCGGGYFMASPNPGDSYIEIDVDKEEAKLKQISFEGDILLKLFDKMGTVKLTTEFKNFPYRIDTGNLPEGLYVVLIMNGKNINSLELIVKH